MELFFYCLPLPSHRLPPAALDFPFAARRRPPPGPDKHKAGKRVRFLLNFFSSQITTSPKSLVSFRAFVRGRHSRTMAVRGPAVSVSSVASFPFPALPCPPFLPHNQCPFRCLARPGSILNRPVFPACPPALVFVRENTLALFLSLALMVYVPSVSPALRFLLVLWPPVFLRFSVPRPLPAAPLLV